MKTTVLLLLVGLLFTASIAHGQRKPVTLGQLHTMSQTLVSINCDWTKPTLCVPGMQAGVRPSYILEINGVGTQNVIANVFPDGVCVDGQCVCTKDFLAFVRQYGVKR